MRKALSVLAGLALALSLPAGAVYGSPRVAAPDAAAPVVSLADLAQESCVAIPDDQRGHDPATPPLLALTCNGNPTPVGLLRPSFMPLGIPAAGPARHAAIDAAARRSLASAEITRRMTCRSGHWFALAPGSGDIDIALCTLREGNWPQLLVTYAQGRTLYQGAGLPVLLPVLVQAIAAESGSAIALPAAATNPTSLGTVLGSAISPCTARDFAASEAAFRQARIFNSRDDAADAETAYRTALDIQTRVFGANAIGVGEVLAALALEVSNQARFDEAASYFRRAEPIVERAGSDFYRARLLSYQALDAANRNHYDEALAFARQASAIRRRAISGPGIFSDDAGTLAAQSISRGELLHSLMIEAQMLLRLDDLASAEAAAGEALDMVTHTDGLPPWWRANVLAFMGDLNARQGRLAVAERQHLDALRFRQRIFGETGPTALSHLALGKIYGAEDARDAALASYHAAFDILEKDHASRAAVSFNQISPFFKVASDPATKPTPAGDAEIFRAIQLTGASVTDQTIERSANRLASADPAISALIGQTEAARRQLSVLRITYAEETDKPAALRDAKRETELAAQIVAAESALAGISAKLKTNFPAYSGLAEPGTVTLSAFREHLAAGEALVAIALGSKDGWAVLVSRDRLVARPLNVGDADVAEQVASLRRAFTPRLGKLAPFDLTEANGLYSALVAPLDDQLGGIRRIIFVTHGALASLPLAVLTRPGAAGGAGVSYQSADWLVNRFAVSQVPTIRSFVALREAGRHHAAPALPFLGFGAPEFTGPGAIARPGIAPVGATALAAMTDQCRAGGPVAPDLLRALAPLPETATEVTTVARLLGADARSLHLGEDASETTLRRQPLDRYGVLYFATHGLLPGELHCQSEPGLALSPPLLAPATRAEDGLLDSSEIAGFKLNADLVVLSACNTAEGTGHYGGDALSGLAEAFFYAGARGLIASHWQVPSIATVALMTGMFENVKAAGTAEALRQSQLRLIRQPGTAHPFYWAAFTLIGDGLTP